MVEAARLILRAARVRKRLHWNGNRYILVTLPPSVAPQNHGDPPAPAGGYVNVNDGVNLIVNVGVAPQNHCDPPAPVVIPPAPAVVVVNVNANVNLNVNGGDDLNVEDGVAPQNHGDPPAPVVVPPNSPLAPTVVIVNPVGQATSSLLTSSSAPTFSIRTSSLPSSSSTSAAVRDRSLLAPITDPPLDPTVVGVNPVGQATSSLLISSSALPSSFTLPILTSSLPFSSTSVDPSLPSSSSLLPTIEVIEENVKIHRECVRNLLSQHVKSMTDLDQLRLEADGYTVVTVFGESSLSLQLKMGEHPSAKI
ncbi:hypothetical protein CCACVL1_24949 [Corchorus capsularis]|uniref:Uncharacterized protein n=1 Tax=Corchorus capsularis TaxID=210143 RepID=A0A1R3GMF8_COCAP|nr:hypothetical protein CCACVL1_24949 [Corchorus capsularis]